jgi:hypothetical protein
LTSENILCKIEATSGRGDCTYQHHQGSDRPYFYA